MDQRGEESQRETERREQHGEGKAVQGWDGESAWMLLGPLPIYFA